MKLRTLLSVLVLTVVVEHTYEDGRQRYQDYKTYVACHAQCRETRGGKTCRAKCPSYP